MNELIKVEVREGRNVVNARDLHKFLKVGRDFSNWIKHRIEKYDFIENQDFIVYAKNGENLNGGRPSIEYAITIDMAKQLSMIENNELGKMARKYFIECEKKLKDMVFSLQIPRTFSEALRLAADQQEKIEQQQKTIEAHESEILALSDKVSEMQPKVTYYDQILSSKNTILLTQIAKDYGCSATKFNKILSNLHIQYRMRDQWVLYAEHAGKGYTKSTSYSVDCHDGTYITKLRTEWTQKGRLFLYDKLKANGILPTMDDSSASA